MNMTNLQWVRDKETCFLKDQETTLLTLHLQQAGDAQLQIRDKQYRIRRKGFWKPVYQILQNETTLVTLSHGFWGSNGKIVFGDGTVCTMEYKNRNGLKLCFMDQEKEILSFGTVFQNGQYTISFHIGIVMEDAEKLLLLSALGMTIFSCMVKENISDDVLITMIA